MGDVVVRERGNESWGEEVEKVAKNGSKKEGTRTAR